MSQPLQQQTQQLQAEQAQAAQAGLAAVFLAQLALLIPKLDVERIERTTPAFSVLVADLVRRFSQASATLAARRYQAARDAAGVSGRFLVKPADPPPLSQIGSTVQWAVHGLYGADPDVAAFEKRLGAATEALVLDTGRQTVIDNTQRDPQAKRWSRVTEPDPCYFCALLAVRGAVYRSEASAEFKAHDNCRCQPEPMFYAYEPPARVREWAALYDDPAIDKARGNDKLREWRRIYNEASSRTADVSPNPAREVVPA